MTTGTASRLSPSDVLDIASVAFGRLLREREVAVSPAEVVELRTVLAMVGTSRAAAARATPTGVLPFSDCASRLPSPVTTRSAPSSRRAKPVSSRTTSTPARRSAPR